MLKHLIVAGTIAVLGCTTALGAGDGAPPPGRAPTPSDDVVPLSALSRDPMWEINCFSGERNRVRYPEENASGVRGNWRGPEGLEWLTTEMRKGYALGARRFLIARPMGTDGESHVSAAGWLTIPPEKRMAMEERINALVFDEFSEPVEIHYYIGACMVDPRSLKGSSPENLDSQYWLGDEGDLAQQSTRVTLGGLMGVGATGFGIDASGPERCRDHFIQLAEQLRRPPFNIVLMGEAMPTVAKKYGGILWDNKGNALYDEDALRRMPWIAIEKYHDYRVNDRVFDHETTRVYKWHAFDSQYRGLTDQQKYDLAKRDVAQGLIAVTHDPALFQAALLATREWEQGSGLASTDDDDSVDLNSEAHRQSMAD